MQLTIEITVPSKCGLSFYLRVKSTTKGFEKISNRPNNVSQPLKRGDEHKEKKNREMRQWGLVEKYRGLGFKLYLHLLRQPSKLGRIPPTYLFSSAGHFFEHSNCYTHVKDYLDYLAPNKCVLWAVG